MKLEFSDGDSTSNTRWTIALRQPAALMEGGESRLDCKAANGSDLGIWMNETGLRCIYQPEVGKKNEDEVFEYLVTRCDDAPAAAGRQTCNAPVTSAPAKVTVTVKPQGLRWDFVVGGGTGKSSSGSAAGAGTSSENDILGATAPDFVASLDWAISNPRKTKPAAKAITAVAGDLTTDLKATKGQKATTPIDKTRSAHIGVMFALSSQPIAVMSSVQGTTDGSTPPAGSGTPAPKSAMQRMFTSAAEINYNAVWTAASGGTYVETGAIARGAFDAPIEDATSIQQVASQVLKVVRLDGDTGVFRFEGGFRASLKQNHHDLQQLMIRNDQIEAPSNPDELVRFELAYQRNAGMEGLSKTGGSTADRYALRLIGFPELPGPAHTKVFLGIEVNGDMRGNSARQWKILYGVDLSKVNTSLF